MVASVPLQVIDTFLLDYHVGHVLVLGFALSVLGVLPLRSMKALSLNVVAFGLLFLLTPASLMANDPLYKFLGVALLVAAPMVYVFGRE